MDEKAKDDKVAKVDSSLISEILGVMKNEFNKQTQQQNENSEDCIEIASTSSSKSVTPNKIIPSSVDSHTEDSSDSTAKRSLRSQYKSPEDPPPEGTVAAEVKRSARRSKGPGESILQTAIARKEKSFCTSPSNSGRKLRANSGKKSKNLKMSVTPKRPSLPVSPTAVPAVRKRGRPPNSEKGDNPVIISAEITTPLHELGIKEEPKDNEDSESVASARTEEDVATPGSKSPRVAEPGARKRRIAEEKEGSSGGEELRKRPRRAARTAGGIPSPSLADSSSDSGQPAKPESSAISHANPALKRVLCCCRARRGPRAAMCSVDPMPSSDGEEGPSTGEMYCQAVESVDQTLVGCCNMAATTRLRRPASKIPYMLLCESHAHRLALHNCCPGCGIFCSQGRFVQCEWGGRVHHFHRTCQLVVGGGEGGGETLCPHCGAPTPDFDVRLEMKMPRKPVFLPIQNQMKHGPSAKMGFTEHRNPPVEDPDDPLPQTSFVLPTLSEGPHSEEDKEKYSLKNLFSAAKTGDTETVLKISSFGHSVNHIFPEFSQQTALHAASQYGHLATVHLLVQVGAQLDSMDCEQLTPLMLAVLAGHGIVVKYLVKAGASVVLKGNDGMTALHLAAKSGNLEACTLLLTEHSNATPRTLLDAQDDGGWTALVWACEHSHFTIVKFLMSKRADPLIRDSEQNIALHWSTFSGSVDISELLLNYGCNVNATNAQGDTPLHIGARQANYECVLLLLARGARVEACNLVGDKPLDCCPPARKELYTAILMNVQLQQILKGTVERTQRILSNDVTRGKETNPIQVLNGLDDEGIPTDFVYVSENCFTSDIRVDRKITSLQSCRCTDSCSTANCLCAHISLRCWYDEEGKLVPDFNFADPPLLFECNVGCGCNRVTCNNRVIQHGPTSRFQLFRTDGKGWGVRTLRAITKGTYVCEYIGEIISDHDADKREDDSYLFDLDNRDGETYCIDARRYGNVARFINHMCTPNLLPVKVFIDHQDLKFPRIAFFANRDIAADEELGFDYGEKFWIIKCKAFTCTCGADNCRYSSTTIQQTLENYNRRIHMEELGLRRTNPNI